MSRLLKKIDEYIERRDNLKRKVNINMVPEYSLVVNNFETEDFKKLAVAGLEAAPLQFWIMPAAMSKKVHHSSEHGIGEVEYDQVNKIHYVKKIGGKAFHTLRVLDIAEIFMEADDPRVRNFRGNVIDTKKVPIVIGIGDIGKMNGFDSLKKNSPVTRKAIDEILLKAGI